MQKLLIIFAILLIAGAAAAQETSVFFSEYIEGSSNNKAVEIFNATGNDLDLSRISLERYNNGATEPGFSTVLAGVLVNGGVYTIANSSADQAILDVADDIENSSFTWYNGDDVLIMYLDGQIVDSIGRLGEDPGSFWGTPPCATAEQTLVRKADICVGDTDVTDEYDPAVEWDCYDQDTFTYLGFNESNCEAVASDEATFGAVKALYR